MPQKGVHPTIAYFINQYPSPSHTFIRREIEALEREGVNVVRITIRKFPGRLLDQRDIAELARTHQILAWGGLSLLLPLLRMLARHPIRLARMMKVSLDFSGRGLIDLVRHLAYVAEACVAARWVERAGAQHVHAHFASNSTMVALLCGHLGAPRFSVTIHGPEEFEDPSGYRLAKKIAAASFVVAVSEDGATKLRPFVDDPQKIKLVRCGVDETFLDSAITPPPHERRILFVGRFHERKNPAAIQSAVVRLRERQVPVHVTYIGDGPLLASQRQNSERLGLLGTNETYFGWCDSASIREKILKSRALVLASRAEGLPVVFMEAMALGRPVIASDVGGVSELVEHGVNGWLVPPGDPEALAAAIGEAVAASPERLNEMGQQGRQRVIDLHDAAKNARRLLKLFEEHISK